MPQKMRLTREEAALMARVYVLALAVYREARGESHRGKLLVCQVIENRVQDPRFPDCYEDVITQPVQFSSFNQSDPQVRKFPTDDINNVRDTSAWRDCMNAALEVLQEDAPLTIADHFVTVELYENNPPSWLEGREPIEVEGGHAFFHIPG